MRFIQAAFSSSCGNTLSAGLLRSTSVTRLPSYYEPLRLPIGSSRGYLFPPGVGLGPTRRRPPARVSQVPDCSVDARCPLSPRGARPLHMFVASRSMVRLHLFWRAGHSQLRHEAETGSLALRLASLPSGASDGGLLRRPPGQLHGERTTSTVSTFQLTRAIRLHLTHQKGATVAKISLQDISFASFANSCSTSACCSAPMIANSYL
jgi:hypothetical protein